MYSSIFSLLQAYKLGGGRCVESECWAPVDLISMLFSGVVSSAYLVIIFCHDEVLHFLDQLDSLFY